MWIPTDSVRLLNRILMRQIRQSGRGLMDVHRKAGIKFCSKSLLGEGAVGLDLILTLPGPLLTIVRDGAICAMGQFPAFDGFNVVRRLLMSCQEIAARRSASIRQHSDELVILSGIRLPTWAFIRGLLGVSPLMTLDMVQSFEAPVTVPAWEFLLGRWARHGAH